MTKVTLEVEVETVKFEVDTDKLNEIVALHERGDDKSLEAAGDVLNSEHAFGWEDSPQRYAYWERVVFDLQGAESSVDTDDGIVMSRPDAIEIIKDFIARAQEQMTGGTERLKRIDRLSPF